MIKVTLLAVGKLKEDYWRAAVKEYEKRLARYAQFEIVEMKEEPDTGDAVKQCETEGRAILAKAKGYVILTDIDGQLFRSEELAQRIGALAVNGQSELTFVIGGSRGVSPAVKERADARLSFGRLTYPHQMMRVMLAEQIYRAFTILENGSYHK